MSLEDRDWYRADLTRRQHRMRSVERRRALTPLATAAAFLAAVVAAAPW